MSDLCIDKRHNQERHIIQHWHKPGTQALPEFWRHPLFHDHMQRSNPPSNIQQDRSYERLAMQWNMSCIENFAQVGRSLAVWMN